MNLESWGTTPTIDEVWIWLETHPIACYTFNSQKASKFLADFLAKKHKKYS